ncbi:MAG TPA: hypothetical protein ENJ09_06305, partial [Planctomycetes bacterium]|nr:hypothetical protein [Planctomycetota bacterium]
MKVRLPLLYSSVLSLLALAAPSLAQRPGQVGPGRSPGNASITLTPNVISDQPSLDFGAVAQGASKQLSLTLTNTGKTGGLIRGMQLRLDGAGNGTAWQADLEGTVLQGGTLNTAVGITRQLLPGESVPVTVTFTPNAEQYDALVLRFTGNFDGGSNIDVLDVTMTGLGGHEGDPYLHVVINAPSFLVDYDGDGQETVTLDGSSSHTHEPGRTIIAYEWSEGGSVFSTSAITTQTFASGSHQIELKIFDDNIPSHTLEEQQDLDVIGPGEVPGVLARYYDAGGSGASSLLDAVPSSPDFGEILSTTYVGIGNTVGSSTLVQNTMVQLSAVLLVTTQGSYDFTTTGGSGVRLELDGSAFSGPQNLSPGT